MKLLLTCDAVGGVWQYSLDLARGLKAHGVETVLAVMGPIPDAWRRPPHPLALSLSKGSPSSTPLDKEEEGFDNPGSSPEPNGFESIEVIQTDLSLDWLAGDADEVRAAGVSLAQLARDTGADLVQLHAPALVAHVGFSVPVVAVVHSDVGTWWAAVRGGELPEDFRWRADLTAAGLRTADLAVAPSQAFADAVAATYGIRPHAVRNGRTASAVPVAPQVDVGLTAGRLWDAAKDLATFDAAASIATTPFRAAGPVAGPHGERILLRHAEALGTLSEAALAAQFAARPVFVSTAVYEPFGLAVLEAAQAGCALVLADTPTFRELWDGAALFVPPRDPAAVARAVDELIANPELRDAYGRAARAGAADYTPEATAAAMASLYAGLLQPELDAAA